MPAHRPCASTSQAVDPGAAVAYDLVVSFKVRQVSPLADVAGVLDKETLLEKQQRMEFEL